MTTTFSETEWQKALDIRAEKAGEAFKGLIKTIAQLRHPTKGCPWDLEQTHASLRRYMLEEAYEAVDTMSEESSPAMIDELGDVLLQVVLNAQLATDAGPDRGDIEAIVRGLNDKMIRRHPHVFAPNDKTISSQEVTAQWAVIKQNEKPKGSQDSVFAKARKVHPALTQAFQIGKTAKKIAFDWHTTDEVFAQLQSELAELHHEIEVDDKTKIADELSDCFFSMAQLSRHLGHEPEEIAQRGNAKFLKRFETIETFAKERGINVNEAGQAKLEELWIEAKKKQKS
ncbi:MAG: nucleoside triphosphate pyrophosphohydrolase [Chitinophagaceae bacterium]|nr:nucleoside triphosphate pyrophosphohydrolase [Oligoflexus sp.]